eukprot:TRINITY_DN677_c0_g1_i1.p1 TRINITY_DN677_c0_g1~~TRINITY_DN677_c0_g1_i1.p1  ORF type:complete len:346 (+),score=80.52 TRINITY_DN677_c0_g1_i1:95-1132(+)
MFTMQKTLNKHTSHNMTDIQVEILDTTNTTLLNQWYDHVALVFEGASREYFVNHHESDPEDSVIFYVKDDEGEIMSTVKLFSRKVCLKGAFFTVGAIGEVSTKVAFRGRGLASLLLKHAIDEMKEKGTDLSLLGTGPDMVSFYGRLGWSTINRYESTRDIVSVESELDGISFEIVDKDLLTEIPDEMKRLHEGYNANHNGWFQRDDRYWNSWVMRELTHPDFYVVTIKNDDNEMVGYVIFKRIDDLLEVRDIAYVKDIPLDNLLDRFARVLVSTRDELKEVSKLYYPTILEKDFPAESQVIVDTGFMCLPISMTEEQISSIIDTIKSEQSDQATDNWTMWFLDNF